jgi:hypothetical protein
MKKYWDGEEIYLTNLHVFQSTVITEKWFLYAVFFMYTYVCVYEYMYICVPR